jgi:hypothetical protein
VKGSTPQNPDPEIERGNAEDAEFSTNQEGSVVPWFAGEQQMALRWVSPVYGQFTAESGEKRKIHTVGIGAVSLDSMAVAVIGIDRLLSISLDSMAVGIAGQDQRIQALSLDSMAVGVTGQETRIEALSLDSLAVVIIGQETI